MTYVNYKGNNINKNVLIRALWGNYMTCLYCRPIPYSCLPILPPIIACLTTGRRNRSATCAASIPRPRAFPPRRTMWRAIASAPGAARSTIGPSIWCYRCFASPPSSRASTTAACKATPPRPRRCCAATSPANWRVMRGSWWGNKPCPNGRELAPYLKSAHLPSPRGEGGER